jgi:hypothetical protein
MDRPFHRHVERRRGGGATAFENAHGELCAGRLEGEAKAGRRGFLRGLARAEQHDESAARLGSDRETAQFFIPGMTEPSDQGMAWTGSQHLLRSPQGIAPAGCSHYGEMGQVDPCGGQGGRIGQMRRRQPHDTLTRSGEPGQCRKHKLQLADSLLQAEDLGERRSGPAAPRQLPVELHVTCGNR